MNSYARFSAMTATTITDPRVRELADQIIQSQREEIAQMKRLINEFEGAK